MAGLHVDHFQYTSFLRNEGSLIRSSHDRKSLMVFAGKVGSCAIKVKEQFPRHATPAALFNDVDNGPRHLLQLLLIGIQNGPGLTIYYHSKVIMVGDPETASRASCFVESPTPSRQPEVGTESYRSQLRYTHNPISRIGISTPHLCVSQTHAATTSRWSW
jgi:hypothetical protein